MCVSPPVSVSPGVSLFSLSVHLSVSSVNAQPWAPLFSYKVLPPSVFQWLVQTRDCVPHLCLLCCITCWVDLGFSDYTKFRHGLGHWLGTQSKIFFRGKTWYLTTFLHTADLIELMYSCWGLWLKYWAILSWAFKSGSSFPSLTECGSRLGRCPSFI